MFLKTPKEFLKIFLAANFLATDFRNCDVYSTNSREEQQLAPCAAAARPTGKPSVENPMQQLAPSLNADRTS